MEYVNYIINSSSIPLFTYINNIISGEQFQQLSDIYLGFTDDFNYNPIIKQQTHKHRDLNQINEIFDNPYIIFCYGHRINVLSNKIELFKNEFILITHNSDENIMETKPILHILSNTKLKKWYCQNLNFKHNKLTMIPIGIANAQWPHGNRVLFNNPNFMNSLRTKTKRVYFNFQIDTNPNKREHCYNNLINKLEWLPQVHPIQHFLRLKEYEFCICPEGNGVDTHRLWEAIYLKTIPVVINSPFIETLKLYNIPMVILDKWEDFDESKLFYSDYIVE